MTWARILRRTNREDPIRRIVHEETAGAIAALTNRLAVLEFEVGELRTKVFFLDGTTKNVCDTLTAIERTLGVMPHGKHEHVAARLAAIEERRQDESGR